MEDSSKKSLIKRNSSQDDEEIVLQKMMLKEMRDKISELVSKNDPAVLKTLRLLIAQDELKNNK